MADSGQEQRAILWSQAARLVGVPSVEAVDAASDAAATFRDLADAPQAQGFLSTLASRLKQHFDNSDAHQPDWFHRGRQFNDLLTPWAGNLDRDTGLAIAPLVSVWALDPDCTDIAVPGLDLLFDHSKPAWDEAIGTLLQNDVAAFPPQDLFVRRRARPVAPGRARCKAHSTARRDHPADPARRRCFGELPRARHIDPARSMVGAAMARPPRTSVHKHPEHVSERRIPRRLLPERRPPFRRRPRRSGVSTHHAVVRQRGRQAGRLRRPARRHRRTLAGHRCAVGDYNPDDLVERACQFIEQHPDRADLGDVLASLIRLSEGGVTSETVDSRIASVMPMVWRVDHRRLAENARYATKVLQPSHTADILNGGQPPETSQQELTSFLKQVVAAYDADECFDVLEAIVEQPPSELFDTPDGALGQWLALAGDRSDAIARRGVGRRLPQRRATPTRCCEGRRRILGRRRHAGR